MKRLTIILFFLSFRAFGAVYTVTANNGTMHVGDLVPPLTFYISTYTGSYSSLFNNEPTCTTTATSTATVGTYPITCVSALMTTVNEGDNLTFVAGTMKIIASDGIGAALTNSVTYPSGWFSAPAYAPINVKSNSICDLAGNGSTDDTNCLQTLAGWGRDSRSQTVTVKGTTVTVTGTQTLSFTGLTGAIQIAGVICTIASVTDASDLVLSSSCLGSATLTGQTLRPSVNTVSTGGTTVTASSGPSFGGLTGFISIEGVEYTISSVKNSRTLVTSESLPTLANVPMLAGDPGTGWGRQPLTLYFPATRGGYLISNPISIFGNYVSWLGQGAQSSFIKLAPNSAAYNNGVKNYMILFNSVSVNDNFREFIENMGFEVGVGNPEAEAVHWLNNNMGAMRNVQIWNDDSAALQGIGLEGAYAGPTLFKNVGVYGFQTGVQAQGQDEYSFTMEGITTEGQQVVGFNTAQMPFSLRHWLSDNVVPALFGNGGGSIAILNSEILYTGGGTVTGMTNGMNGNLYGLSVSCTGYSPCETDRGGTSTVTRTAFPTEFWTGTAQCEFCSGRAGSLGLPISETPVATDPAVSTWTKLGTNPTTWASTISASSSTTVYLPPGIYSASADQTITIPDTVNHLIMYNSQFNPPSLLPHYLNVNVTGSSSTPLVIDGCMYQECLINHSGTRTVAFTDTALGYQAQPGTGNVFFEDIEIFSYDNPGTVTGDGPTFYPGQSVWARQFDDELGTATNFLYPKFTCNTCILWILGYKTEQDSPSVVENQQGEVEIFGFFFYPLHQVLQPAPPQTCIGSSPICVSNSSFFAASGYSETVSTNVGWPCYIIESQKITWMCLPGGNISSPQMLNLYY